MTMQTIHKLTISWTISKGRDTYGYNICRLDHSITGKRYKCMGGGYDMVGDCLGQFVTDYLQADLMALADQSYYTVGLVGSSVSHREGGNNLYGVYAYYKDGQLVRVSVDGSCGVDSVRRIVEAMGYEFESVYNKRKQATEAFYIGKEL